MDSQIIKEFINKIDDIHLPRWDELPEFNIYMDQVITILDRYLKFIKIADNDVICTQSMINNYVKLRLIKRPYKKQYTKEHLASLIAIIILKQVFPITEIRDGIIYQSSFNGYQDAYNCFCVEIEKALKEELKLNVEDNELDNTIIDSDESKVLVKMATKAFASKFIVSNIIYLKKKERYE